MGKAVRDGKPCYYINDGVYHTYSGQVFDHVNYPVLPFKGGETQISAVFGPTCDAFDTITLSAELPDLDIGDLVYSENIGAYSHASSTYFNGFPPEKSCISTSNLFLSFSRYTFLPLQGAADNNMAGKYRYPLTPVTGSLPGR